MREDSDVGTHSSDRRSIVRQKIAHLPGNKFFLRLVEELERAIVVALRRVETRRLSALHKRTFRQRIVLVGEHGSFARW